MSEETMIDNAIELNKVDGFDPKQYIRIIQTEEQPPKYYLDVVYRKFWFRLKYPMGKIKTKLIKLSEQMAVVEARVYMDRNDPEENYISNALSQKYFSNDLFGTKYIELAETAAVGRALASAGFGLQFALEDIDTEVVDAPIECSTTSIDINQNLIIEVETDSIENSNKEQIIKKEISNQNSISSSLPPAMQQQSQTKPLEKQAIKQPISGTNSTLEQSESSPIEKKELTKDMPVDTIYAQLTRDTAAAVVVSCGFFKGKTLGQVAVEKPSSLNWYINSYNGSDNLLRAAAKFLLDAVS